MRSYWTRLLLVFLVPSLFLGCSKDKNSDPVSPQETILLTRNNLVIHEDAYVMLSGFLELPAGRSFRIELNLKSWANDYGIELFLLNDDQAARYAAGLDFSVNWHETVSTQGDRVYLVENLPARTDYRMIIDNTNRGWETTDFDGVDDTAIVDIEIKQVN